MADRHESPSKRHLVAASEATTLYSIRRGVREEDLSKIADLRRRAGLEPVDELALLARTRGSRVVMALAMEPGTYIPDFTLDRGGVRTAAPLRGFGVIQESSGVIQELIFDYEAIDRSESKQDRRLDRTLLEMLIEEKVDSLIFGFADSERQRELFESLGLRFHQRVGEIELYGGFPSFAKPRY